jgi:tetratricopeptide (TPR) repeat protein
MRIGRLSFLLCILLLPGMDCIYASSARKNAAAFFAQGNSEYQKGDYASAERYYLRILDSGVDSGPLYYNLGNACFKQKRIGEAVYYWEKAQRKLPGDREIQENLQLANLMLVDRIETPADPLPLQILAKVPELLTAAQERRLLLVLFVAANILFSVYLLARNPRHAFGALVGCFGIGLVFLFFACSLSWKVYEQHYRKEGVVIEQKVDVRSGPGTENITVFTIHEGIKVRVYGSSDGWYQISLPNGWNGWLPQNYLRVL